MILRDKSLHAVTVALGRNPIAALLGPRQVGKTTLARQVRDAWSGPTHVFDLEDPAAVSALESPVAVLEPLRGLVVIDEIQRAPQLFPVLRVLADRSDAATRFLLLGSAAPQFVKAASESLAGRVEFVELGGLSLEETGREALERLWCRGGFPRSFLAASDVDSASWREHFVRTFLERDLPQLGLSIPALRMRRFWTMVAHYHAQTWNHAEVAASLDVDEKTTRRYLEVLAGAFMLRVLPPWFENVAKRQRRAPKVYFRDTGLLHTLLRIGSTAELTTHPRLGASWEGFALEQIARRFQGADLYSWSVHSGPELDLLAFDRQRRLGFEFKFSDAPRLTRAMEQSVKLLSLDHLAVVYPGERRYPLSEKIEVVPLGEAATGPRSSWIPRRTTPDEDPA